MQMASGDARTDQLHVLELKRAHVRDLASIIKAISFREVGLGLYTTARLELCDFIDFLPWRIPQVKEILIFFF